MPDILDAIAKLQKAHDYYGKATDLIDAVSTVKKAAKIDPKDPKQLKELVGITDKQTEKLLKVLNTRAKATEEAAAAAFPDIPADTTNAWAAWFKAADKYGMDSKEEYKARQAYLKALLKFDLLLRERITYCDILIKQSTSQEKVYVSLVELHENAEKICLAVIAAPSTKSTAPQATAMKTLLKFNGVRGPAIRIHKAHAKIVSAAEAEKKKWEKVKKTNDVWISDVQAKNLRGVVNKAMAALGIKV